jgi:hypothetical protein
MNHPEQGIPPAAERPAVARRGVLQRGLAGADRGVLLLLAALPPLALWSPALLGA